MASPEVGRLYQGVAKESAAFKLMKQMGWEEGQGLGKNKQGISTHVRVSKKFDSAGIGIAEAKKEASNWSVNTAVFDSILKNLNIKAKENILNPANEKSEDSSKSSGSSDIDETSNMNKRGSVEEKPKESREVKKVARPQGRYKRREAGKCVKSYSESDLSAILGLPPAAVSAPQQPKAEEIPEKANGQPEALGQKDDEGTGKKAKKQLKASKSDSALAKAAQSESSKSEQEKKQGDECSVEERPKKKHRKEQDECSGGSTAQEKKVSAAEAEAASDVTSRKEAKAAVTVAPPPDWWGHRCGFVAAGELGSAAEKQKEKKKGFSETDQEGLYHLVNNTATSGKKGLGVNSLPKKVAGARWKGQKVTFDVDAGEGDGTEGSDADSDASQDKSKAADSDSPEETKTTMEATPTTQHVKKGEGKGSSQGKECEGPSKQVPWKKIILKILAKESDGIQIDQLKALAIKKASSGGNLDKDELGRQLTSKLKKLNGKVLKMDGDSIFRIVKE